MMESLFSGSSRHIGADVEKRRDVRRAVGFRANLREPGTTRFAVDVVNLSVSGFGAETSVTLNPGQTVWVTLPGFAALETVVAWRNRYRYGCSLRRPLHHAVLTHIVNSNGG